MLRIEQLSIVLTLMLLCIQGSVSLAQKDISYWGPDTTLPAPRHLQTYGEILDYNFKHVDQFMSTDILADRNPNVTRREQFDGQNLDVVANKDDFYLIRAEMEDARVPYPNEIKSLFDIHKEVGAHYEATGEVIVGVCDYDYEEIKQDAKDNGDIFWDGYQVKFQGGKDPFNMLEQKNTFVMLPLLSDIATDGWVTFNFSLEHIYTNLDDHIDHIAVDFGDGNGFVNLIIGQSYSVYYPEPGEHELTMMVNYVNRGYKQVKGLFVTRVKAIIIENDCGDGIIVNDGIQYVELPQAHLNVNVPEVIENEKNDFGMVEARAGIWFGCGDPCVVDKPFIIVTGYGPDIGKKNIWSDEPTKNLYSHFNGILGLDAETKATRGMPNGTNLLYKLRNEGYDIIILEFLNGVDYPQNHAAAVMRLIELVNQEKDNNGSMHENILMGQSMGGISSRIALARWEKERMAANSSPFVHHECRTWINWEGEMQGATIPMGIQLYAKFLTSEVPEHIVLSWFQNIQVANAFQQFIDVFLFDEALNNPAAQSILTYHVSMNDQANDPILYRHPKYLALFAQMDELGYPQHVRRVAIADGSSTVERPLGLDRDANGNALNTCLMDLFGYIPIVKGKLRVRINTGELLQSKTIFRGWFTIRGASVGSALKNVKKIYPKAEYDAPAAYERFYKKFVLGVAKYGLKGCKVPDYRAPFVPTTSVFDVQDDYSLDYGYNCFENLFFLESGEFDPNESKGYPHNNPNEQYPYAKTPFDACFANQKNTLHNQNPGSDLASFILDEVAPFERFIQKKNFSSLPVEYESLIEARESLTIGSSVTQSVRIGEVILGENTKALYRAPRVKVRDGVHIMEGASLVMKSEAPLNVDCIQLLDSKRGYHANAITPSNKVEHESLINAFAVFPNPTQGILRLEAPDNYPYRVEVRDLTGRLLTTSYSEGSTQLTLEHSSGLFFINVLDEKSNQTIYSTKVIKL